VESLVPVLVDRRQPTDLSAVIENAIDRSLIAGLKPSAAEGIADGIARQLAHEFAKGRSVGFGQYFYGRPYLSGTVDANGRLTSENGINVRLYKGEDFKLTLDDFSFSYEDGGTLPKVDFVLSSPGNLRGEVVTGGEVSLQGRMLHLDGDANTVTFTEAGGTGTPVVVDSFKAAGPDILSFDCPAALVAGKRYEVVATRTDENGMTRTSNAKVVTVKAGETPPGPTPTGPTVTAINDGTFHDGSNVVTGADMRFSDAYPATHVTIKTAAGEPVSAMIGDDGSVEPGPERFALSISVDEEMTPGAEYTFEFAMIDEEGTPVTVTKTARWAE
jgi:hypothetical protein